MAASSSTTAHRTGLTGCFSQLQITFGYHHKHPASRALMHFTFRGDLEISSACVTCYLPASGPEELQLKQNSSRSVGQQPGPYCSILIRQTCCSLFSFMFLERMFTLLHNICVCGVNVCVYRRHLKQTSQHNSTHSRYLCNPGK